MTVSLNEKDHSYGQILRLIQPVLDSVSEMQGIWLKFVDTSGEYIFTSQSTNPCNFCQYIRSTLPGLNRCRQFARMSVEKSIRQKGPLRMICHAGLSTITVPVMIGDQCLGALVAGEIVEQHLRESIRQDMVKTSSGLDIDLDTLLTYFDQIPTFPEKRIEAITRSLDAFSNCFIEIGVAAVKKEKTELEKHLKEMELKALQNQINPHFLFNTLNTIEMLAMMEGAQQTPKIVHSLADLFRHNLRASSDMVTIRQEMNSVNSYLAIQKWRFGNRIRVANKIPPHLTDYVIPILTLQPLVENAMVHGLEPLEKKGRLSLEGRLEENDIVLQVVDNGTGITPKKLRQIRQQLDRLDGESNKIGLINVQKRCRLHFGTSYGISISSTPGGGTEVSLRLPAQSGKVGVGIEAVNS